MRRPGSARVGRTLEPPTGEGFLPGMWHGHAASPRRRARLLIAALAGVLLLPPGLGAQEELVDQVQDRILAVVGDSVILQTQLQERVLAFQLQGAAIPDDPEGRLAFESSILDQMINEALVLQEALADTTLAVDEERLEEIVTGDLDRRARAMGGQAALEQALSEQGLTIAEFREQIRADARRQQLQQQYVSKARRSVRVDPVDDDSVQAFYEANRDQIGRRPATVTFTQAVVEPGPSEEADSTALADAREIFQQVIAGEDFAALAERHSDDPGSASQGGDLGWFRRNGQMVREFEDVAFSLNSGEVSLPFRTQFGYHVMKVERIRGPERRARHILIKFDIDEAQITGTRALADSIRTRAEAGESLREIHQTSGVTGVPDSLSFPLSELNQLPPGYAPALRNATTDEVLGPIELTGRDVPSFAVIRVIEVRDEGDYTLEDLEENIREQLQQQMILEKLLRQLRERRYVDIRLSEPS